MTLARTTTLAAPTVAPTLALALAGAAAVLAVARGLGILAVYDDAFIHFRIAEAFVATGAPQYNPGEAVMASSSPLWTLLCALLALLPGELPDKTLALNAAAVGAAGALMHAILRGRGAGPVWSVVAALPVLALLARLAAGLMESALAGTLVLAALWLFDRGGRLWVVAAVLAAALRLEYVVVAALLAVPHVLVRREVVRPLLLGVATAAPILVWLLWSFGTVVPNTVAAKAAVYVFSMADVAKRLLPGADIPAKLAAAALYAAAGVAFWRLARRGRGIAAGDPAAWLFAGGALVALSYVAMRSFVHGWYLVTYAVPLYAGAAALAARQPPRVRAALFALVLLGVLPRTLAFAEALRAAAGNAAAFAEYGNGARVEHYLAVARELEREHPGATLATSEIGALGQGFRGRILDGMGLVTPAALAHHPMRIPEQRSSGGIGAIPAAFVAEAKPDLIVTYPIFAEELLRSPVLQAYACEDRPPAQPARMAETPGLTVFGSDRLVVCRRRGG